jgi:Ca-activated chloride channel family protein
MNFRLNTLYDVSSIRKRMVLSEMLFWLIIGISLFFINYYTGKEGVKFVFRKSNYVWLCLVIVPLHIGFLWKISAFFSSQRSASAPDKQAKYIPNRWWAHFMFTRALLFCIMALAQPSIGKQKVTGTLKSMEIVVCLDVSNSMNVKDMSSGEARIAASRRAMTDLVNRLSGEKIGVCVFAGTSLVHLPLTNDYEAAKQFIHEISTDLISLQGTNISLAFETAQKMFSPISGGKAVVLFTDGEDHDGNAIEAAGNLKDAEIQVHVLGLGSKNGGPLPLDPKRPERGYRRSETNQLLISKMNPALITDIATAAQGSYMLTSSAFPNITPLLTEINQIKRTDLRDLSFEMRSNNYVIPLSLALCCFLLFVLINYTENRL